MRNPRAYLSIQQRLARCYAVVVKRRKGKGRFAITSIYLASPNRRRRSRVHLPRSIVIAFEARERRGLVCRNESTNGGSEARSRSGVVRRKLMVRRLDDWPFAGAGRCRCLSLPLARFAYTLFPSLSLPLSLTHTV